MATADDRRPQEPVDVHEGREDAPRGGFHPEEPTGGPSGTVPEAERATFETRNRSPFPTPDEPLPPQD